MVYLPIVVRGAVWYYYFIKYFDKKSEIENGEALLSSIEKKTSAKNPNSETAKPSLTP